MAIARVQSKTANSGGAAAGSLSVVLDSTPTSGNILILVSASTSTLLTIPTTANIAWFTVAARSNAGSVSCMAFIGYVRTGSGSATATITLASGTQPLSAVCAEYSGFTSAQLDTNTGTSGTGTTLATGATPTTRSSLELWLSVQTSRANSTLTYSAPTNGFTIVGQTCTTIGGANADRAVALLEKIVASTGTVNAGVTSSQSTLWVDSVFTLDEASAGSGSAPGGFFVQ